MPDLTIEELLVRNVSLEKEMDSLRTMLNNVAEQRDGFRAQMEALSIEALRLKEESDTARRQSTGLESQRAQMEREYDALRARWSAELEGKSREFEELQNQMIPPRDLEAMRLKLIEETEAPWRERARASEAELERARASATALKRDADQLKAAHDAADLEHRAQLREVQVKQQVELAEARAKAEVAARERGPSTEPTDLERMRRLQRENTEVKVRQEKLLEEVDDVRNENEALRQARQQLLELQAQAQAESAAGGKLQAAERESLRRRASHLGSELESAQSEHSRLHEGYLRQENEARKLRAALDEAQHQLMSEQAGGKMRSSEEAREAERLKLEMERRHTEHLRREALLQASRDEISASAQEAQRDAVLALARVRDDEALRGRKLEAERTRLQEQFGAAQSDAAAAAAAARERIDGALGEASGLKAELHGASLERSALTEEAARLRRRCEAAEERLGSVGSELHALRNEHEEEGAARRRWQEAEQAQAHAHEKVLMQLEAAQREVRATHGRAESATHELSGKLRQQRRQWAKEKAALKQAEAARARMVEALRHELERLRRERETAPPLPGSLLGAAATYHESCCASSSSIGAGGGGALGGGALGGGGALPAELQRLVAEDRQLQEEVSRMKASLRTMEA